ncbi:uncharacterized protein O3C94_011148 [Discoglossus pictus]
MCHPSGQVRSSLSFVICVNKSPDNFATMPTLVSVIQDIVNIFQKYSKKDDCHSKLNKDELTELIQQQFADVIKNPEDPKTTATLIRILDENNDGEVDFNEFCDLLCKVFKAYYKVVYNPEESCSSTSQDTTRKNETSTSQRYGGSTETAEVKPEESKTDLPPKYYQSPVFPKPGNDTSETPKDYGKKDTTKPDHDKSEDGKPQCAAVPTVQSSTQTDPRKPEPTGNQGYDKPKDTQYGTGSTTAPPSTYDKNTLQDEKSGCSVVDTEVSSTQTDPRKPRPDEPKDYSYDQPKDNQYGSDQKPAQQGKSTDSKEGSQKSECSSQKDKIDQGYKDKIVESSQPDKTTPLPPNKYSYQASQPDNTIPQPQSGQEKKDQTPQPDKITPMPPKKPYDQTSQPDNTTYQPPSGQEKKDQTPQPDKTTPMPPKKPYDQTSQPDNTTYQPPSGQEKKDQTPQPDKTTPIPPKKPYDQTSQPDNPTPQTPSGQEKKDQTSQLDKTSCVPPLDLHMKYQSPQPYKPSPLSPRDTHRKDEMSQLDKATHQVTQQKPPSYQQPQQFYQQPVFPTAVDLSKKSQDTSQPPQYSERKPDPIQPQKPEDHQQPPQVPQQPQQHQQYYQYQHHFSSQKKNH